MKPRLVLLLGVAVVGGLAAAFLASQATGKAQVDKVPVPVAIKAIKSGQYLGESPETWFALEDRPRETVTPNTILSMSDLSKKVVQQSLDQGAMVTKAALIDVGGLAAGLEKGQRAMTIRVNIDSAVAGFVVPTSRIDLICTVPDAKDPRQTRARIFLQDIKVLAVNTEDIKAPDQKFMVQPGMVTLALTPEQCERMQKATQDRIPTLVLRKPGDDSKPPTSGAATPFGDNAGGPDAPDTKRVWLAKHAIEPGTPITRFEDLFEEGTYPAVSTPSDAVVEKGAAQGKRVEKYLGAKMPLTAAFLVKEGVSTPVVVAVPQKHTMTIVNGNVELTKDYDYSPPATTRPSKEVGSEGK